MRSQKNGNMRLPQFKYLEPKTLKAAAKALALDPRGSVLLAGGTDLLVNMKHGVIQPTLLINLKKVPGLATLSESRDGIKIGALTSLHDISSSTLVREKHPALFQAAGDVGGLPIG